MLNMNYVDETDFLQEENYLFNIQGEGIKKAFERRNVECSLLQNKENVYQYIKMFIEEHPDIKKIAFSDSVTLYQLGLFDWVSENYSHLDVNQPLKRSKTGHYAVFGEFSDDKMNLPRDEFNIKNAKRIDACRQALLCDLFIISANAITQNGEIISIDGLGNRVSGMIFGPKYVLCIVRKNKICSNIDDALDHIHNYVVPRVYVRHMLKHHATAFADAPCLKTGKCLDCYNEISSCRNTVIIRGQIKTHKDRIHLLLINQNLGF